MRSTTLLTLLALAPALTAQSLVADLAPGGTSSWPRNFAALGGTIYFVADTAAGTELWRSDGTTAGTWMVKDINPAAGASGFPATDLPELVPFGNILLFAASDGVHGLELWRSDGTAAGTTMLLDINPGAADSVPQAFAVAQDRVFFFADTVTEGRELWVTDGTVAGTHMVVDFCTAPGFGGAGDPNNRGNSRRGLLTAVGRNVFFLGTDVPTQPRALCFSDGTAAGTRMVNPAAQFAISIKPFRNGVVFAGYSQATGYEPWFSDGTFAGTAMILDLDPGTLSGVETPIPFRPLVLNDRLYFRARSATTLVAVWTSDGTAVGTVPYFAPGATDPLAQVMNLDPAGDRLYIRSYNPVIGQELYIGDGVATPTLVRDFFPGTQNGVGASAFLGVGVGRVAMGVFRSSLPQGFEPGVTDGTAAGTRVLADLANNNGNDSTPIEYTRAGDRIFFSAVDNGQTGRELYSVLISSLGASDASNYGAGCAGTGNLVPALRNVGAPLLGNAAFAVQLTRGIASAPCFLLLAPGAASVPIGPCTLLVSAATLTFAGATDATGQFTLPLPVPNDLGLVGGELFLQGFVVDAGGALSGIASASDGLRLRVGR